MDRRQFLVTSAGALALSVPGAAAAASGVDAAIAAAPASSTTVLYGDRSVSLDKIRPNSGAGAGKDLWVRAADLPRINEFTLKPQGACREDVCIPIPKELKSGEWFNLTGFAKRTGEVVVSDNDVWSFGEIPVMGGSFINSRIAPDFAVPDRKGKIVHLNDFRGKKVLVVTWASW
jgi:hypothetical protein